MTIDNTVLALFPVDTELTNLPTMTVSSTEVENPAQDGEDPYRAHLGSTFIPLPVRGMTEQQLSRNLWIKKTLQLTNCSVKTTGDTFEIFANTQSSHLRNSVYPKNLMQTVIQLSKLQDLSVGQKISIILKSFMFLLHS